MPHDVEVVLGREGGGGGGRMYYQSVSAEKRKRKEYNFVLWGD